MGKLSAVNFGASNTAKTAAPLKRKGVKTNSLGKMGWRILEDSVAYIENELSLHATWDEIVVLHCLDSSCFYILEKSGAMIIPLHWAGQAVPCAWEGGGGKRSPTDNLLETLERILKGGMDKLTFQVCPTVRHLEPCCMHMNPQSG